MRELLLKLISAAFRMLPHFRGKLNLGRLIGKSITDGYKAWKTPEYFIRLKSDISIKIDVRSETHQMAMWCGKYEDLVIKRFIEVIDDDFLILDVGANIGYYSLQLAGKLKKLGYSGKILSFEPFSSNYLSLEEAIKINKFENYIQAFNFGLGEREQELNLYMPELGITGNAVVLFDNIPSKYKTGTIEKIKIKQFDIFAKEHNITKCDFIKLDIEGMEVFFLRGAKEFIRCTLPIIYGEFNAVHLRNAKCSLVEVYNFFSSLNYDIFLCDIKSKTKCSFIKREKLIDGDENILFVPKGLEVNKRNILLS